jgi:hypothetical protein
MSVVVIAGGEGKEHKTRYVTLYAKLFMTPQK